MIYFKSPTGEIFAYEKQADRERYGRGDLVKLTALEVESHLYSRNSSSSVPARVSRFQARAALHQVGRLAEVEAAISESDAITQMAWQDAQEFRRNSPTILALGEQLGLNLDALFIAAAQIQA